jgi:hypothetical protein
LLLWQARDHWPPDFLELLQAGAFSAGYKE